MRATLLLTVLALTALSAVSALNIHKMTEFEKQGMLHHMENQQHETTTTAVQDNMRAVFRFFYGDMVGENEQIDESCAHLADVMWSEANRASRHMDLVPRPAVFTGNVLSFVRSQVFGAVWRAITNRGIYVAVRNVVANNFRSSFELCKIGQGIDLSRDIRLSCLRRGSEILAKVAGGCKRTTWLSCSNDFECRADGSADDTLGIPCSADCVCDDHWINSCTCVHRIDNGDKCNF